MAAKNLEVNSLVYSYLMNNCPKSAAIFAKTFKAKASPQSGPKLEDVIKTFNLIIKTSSFVMQVAQKSLVKGFVKSSHENEKDSSDSSEDEQKQPTNTLPASSSSESDSGKKPIQKTRLPKTASPKKPVTNIKTTLKKVTASSSSDSESEPESNPAASNTRPAQDKTVQTVKPPVKPGVSSPYMAFANQPTSLISSKILKTVSNFGNCRSDSSSHSEEERVKSIPKPFQAVNRKKLTLTHALAVAAKVGKKAEESSGSSTSDSEEDSKKLAPKTNWSATAVGKNVATNGSSSSESESGKGLSLAKKTSTTLANSKKTDTKQLNGGIAPVNKATLKKKAESSSDSSSSEDEKAKPNLGLAKKSTKAPLAKKQKPDSSDSSSDSEEDKSKSTAKSLKAPQFKLVVPNAVKAPSKAAESSSDSSSEDEAPVKNKAVPQPVNPAERPLANSKKTDTKQLNGGIAPVNKATVKKKAESSSDSSSCEDEKAKPTLGLAKKSTKAPLAKKQKPDSSDSSSDSEEDKSKSTAKSLKAPQVKFLVPNGVKAPSKAAESSSDSTSEDEAPVKNKSVPQPVNPAKRKHDSSSASDSETGNVQMNGKVSERKPKLNSTNTTLGSAALNSNTGQKRVHFGETTVVSDSTKRSRGSSPFRRIKSENYKIDERLQHSSQIAKHEIASLGAARGKQFRHEKTKKKKGNHCFGKIDISSVRSIAFD